MIHWLLLWLPDEDACREAGQLSTPSGDVHQVKHKHKRPTYPSKKSTANSTANPTANQFKSYKCFSCGSTAHRRDKCKNRDAICHGCQRKGHIQSVCMRKRVVYQLSSEDVEQEENVENLFAMTDSKTKGFVVPVLIEDTPVEMQLDTGCSLSLIPKLLYDEKFSHIPLQSADVILSTYTGEKISPLGQIQVNVKYKNSCYSMCLLVTPSGCKPLFGRNWLDEIQLEWHSIFGKPKEVHTIEYSNVNGVVEQYATLFENVLGCYRGTPVELTVNKEPEFHKARPVPYAIRDSVEKELNKMVDEGVLKRVSTASCAAPIVAVPKKNSERIRVCGDFSVTYNSCADVVQYPIPRIEDLHAALQGCKTFSVLDMSQAYHQIPIAEDSHKYLTINTHCGLFQFTRLPNGIHSGPALFQRTMDSLLSGIPGVTCYLDDILVAGKTMQEHCRSLASVFEKLQSAGFKLNKSKCKFEQSSVEYLGHVIDEKGLHPTREKLDAIRDAPAPKDVSALKSFLGLLMFYSRFMSDHATVLAPLNNLLRKNVQWKWTNTEQRAFNDAKKLILESKTLVHYNPALPIYLSCDASSYGAGAVLSHKIDGQYRPISFASCSLTDSQRNYSQIEKEAFSIIFGLKRFHQYIYGRTVTIITDHKPLLSLFAPDRAVPQHVAAKLQRWSLILSSYKYVIEYRNTDLHKDADCMSRIPLPKPYTPKSENSECLFVDSGFDVTTNVTSARIRKCTRCYISWY